MERSIISSWEEMDLDTIRRIYKHGYCFDNVYYIVPVPMPL